MLAAAPLVLSGYFVQTAVDPGWRRAWVAVHLVTASLWIASYLVHQVTPRPASSPVPGGTHAPTQADL
jgi:hypothetical protein